MSSRAPPVVLVREPEVHLPKKFSGSRTDSVKTFKNSMESIFLLQQGSFHSEANKIIYISTFLEGPALNWYLRLVDDGNPALESLPNFLGTFSCSF